MAPTTAFDLRDCDRAWVHAHLATLDPAVEAPYGALRDHALGVKDGRIAAIVPMSPVRPTRLPPEVHDADGGWISPAAVEVWRLAR